MIVIPRKADFDRDYLELQLGRPRQTLLDSTSCIFEGSTRILATYVPFLYVLTVNHSRTMRGTYVYAANSAENDMNQEIWCLKCEIPRQQNRAK